VGVQPFFLFSAGGFFFPLANNGTDGVYSFYFSSLCFKWHTLAILGSEIRLPTLPWEFFNGSFGETFVGS